MKEAFKITSAKRVVDPLTFQPMLKCELYFNIEKFQDLDTGLTEESRNKQFIEKFKKDLAYLLEEDAKIIREFQLIPSSVSSFPYYSENENKNGIVTFPSSWISIDMYQMASPNAKDLDGNIIHAISVKCDVSMSLKQFNDELFDTESNLFNTTKLRNIIQTNLHELKKDGFKYFYTGYFILVTNPITEQYEYNLIMRVAK